MVSKGPDARKALAERVGDVVPRIRDSGSLRLGFVISGTIQGILDLRFDDVL